MTRRRLTAILCSAALATLVTACSSPHHDPHPAARSSASTSRPSDVGAPRSGERSSRQLIPSESSRPTLSATGATVAPNSSITPPAIPNPTSATRAPVDAARAWAIAANSSSYLDPSPGTWTQRTAPFVTGAEAAAELQERGGGGGSTWARIQSGKCVTSLQQLAVTVPGDAPSGPTRRLVYLTAFTTLRCATGQVQVSQFAAQLLLARVADRWLIAEVHH
jgi:hypothetical protein